MTDINNAEHPWHSAYDKFQTEILPKLKKDGMKIGAEAAAGNKRAQDVIRFYSALHSHFDPFALIFLEEALRLYEDQYHTAFEWNDKLEYGIMDYDGFRDGDITAETKMTQQEFERRAQHSTRVIKRP